MKILSLSCLRGSLNMLSTCQHCWGPCKMHFCFIFVIFAFQGVHGSHFSHHFSFHFLDHSDHFLPIMWKWAKNEAENELKMAQKCLLWTTLLAGLWHTLINRGDQVMLLTQLSHPLQIKWPQLETSKSKTQIRPYDAIALVGNGTWGILGFWGHSYPHPPQAFGRDFRGPIRH